MCWECDMREDMAHAIATRDYDPAKRRLRRRGEDQITQYMDEHGVSWPEALDALGEQRRREFAELRAAYAGRHGLDDEQTLSAMWAHGIDGPGEMQ